LSKIRKEQDRLATIILSVLERENVRRTNILKLTLRRCGSPAKFNSIMKYLLDQGYIIKFGKKGTRALYGITEKGKVQLSLLRKEL